MGISKYAPTTYGRKDGTFAKPEAKPTIQTIWSGRTQGAMNRGIKAVKREKRGK